MSATSRPPGCQGAREQALRCTDRSAATNPRRPAPRMARIGGVVLPREHEDLHLRACASRSAISWKPCQGHAASRQAEVDERERRRRIEPAHELDGGGREAQAARRIGAEREVSASAMRGRRRRAAALRAACARRSGAERKLLIADASHEGALEAPLAVALAERPRAAAKAQPGALENSDRRAQLVHVASTCDVKNRVRPSGSSGSAPISPPPAQQGQARSSARRARRARARGKRGREPSFCVMPWRACARVARAPPVRVQLAIRARVRASS